MAQSNINIRMDEDLKNNFNLLCEDLGLTMTVAVNVFARAMIREQGLPFSVIRRQEPNLETKAALAEGLIIGQDPNTPSYNNAQELFASLGGN